MKDEQPIYIVAPNRNYGEHLAYIFNIPKKNIITDPDLFRGLHKCVVLLAISRMYRSEREAELWEELLLSGQHTVIRVPEIALVAR